MRYLETQAKQSLINLMPCMPQDCEHVREYEPHGERTLAGAQTHSICWKMDVCV